MLENRAHFLHFPLPAIGRTWSTAFAQTVIRGVVLWHLICLDPSKWAWHGAQAQEDCRRLGYGAVQDTHLDTQLKSREAGHACPSGAVWGTRCRSRVIPQSVIPISVLWSLLFLPPSSEVSRAGTCPNCKKHRTLDPGINFQASALQGNKLEWGGGGGTLFVVGDPGLQ